MRASGRVVPGDEAAQRRVGPRSRSRAPRPRRAERDLVPDRRRRAPSASSTVGRVGAQLALGDPVGERVHDAAEALRLVGATARRRPRARGTTGPGRSSDRSSALAESVHRLVGRPHRRRASGSAARVPHQRGRVGLGRQRPAADLGRRQARPAGAAAARRSAVGLVRGRRRCAAARRPGPASDSGRARAALHGARTVPTPSSSRNRDGCSPSSSGEATAVTTSRCAGAGARRRRTAGAPRRAAPRASAAAASPSRADPVGLQQGGAAAQVGPAALLHVGDDDERATRGPWTGGR